MQLSSIPGSQKVANGWTKGAELVQAVLGGATATAPGSQPGAAGDVTLRKIAAQYDLTRVSPREFSEMLDRLQQSGALSEADFQDLAGIRLELDKLGLGPDESVDLVKLYQSRLQQIRGKDANSADQKALASAQRQSDWVQRLAEVYAGHGELLDVAV